MMRVLVVCYSVCVSAGVYMCTCTVEFPERHREIWHSQAAGVAEGAEKGFTPRDRG